MAGGTAVTGRRLRLAAASSLTLAAVLGGACSTDTEADPATAPAPATTAPPGASDTSPPGSPPPEAVDPLDTVRGAVVRIETNATSVQPDDPMVAAPESIHYGAGSGFVIDPSGLAVTNDHVVAGATAIEAFVEGRQQPVPAQVVGRSPCADLALIDLDGDGYTALDWYEGDIEPGLEILVPGFPLGDLEYTLVDGIVSKARSSGESSWASVDWVIEHTAPVRPGHSGGPVVNSDGLVVAVDTAQGSPETGSAGGLAIAGEVAEPVIDALRAGTPEFSIGINGQGVLDAATGTGGIWVASVDGGSLAADAGVQPGDIVERLGGFAVGTDGTLGKYCDVLRSHDADDTLSIQVLRATDDGRLRGTLGALPLAPIASLSQEIADEVEFDEEPTGYDEYVLVTDATGALEVEVPSEWSDLDGDFPFLAEDDEAVGVGLRVSPDLEALTDTWTTPGMAFSAVLPVSGYTVDELLATNVEALDFLGACDPGPVEDYDDGLYVGLSQLHTNCGGTPTAYMLIAAEDPANELKLLVRIQITADRDFEALDRIIETFRVVGAVGTLGEDVEGEVDVDPGGSYSGYRNVIDETGVLAVEAPVEWTDEFTLEDALVDSVTEDLGGIGLYVSTDVGAWENSWGVPGVGILATSDWNGSIEDWFFFDRGWFSRSDCVDTANVTAYEDPIYTGLKGTYTDCGGGTDLVLIVAAPADREFVIVVGATLVTAADLEALDRIIATFQVVGPVPA